MFSSIFKRKPDPGVESARTNDTIDSTVFEPSLPQTRDSSRSSSSGRRTAMPLTRPTSPELPSSPEPRSSITSSSSSIPSPMRRGRYFTRLGRSSTRIQEAQTHSPAQQPSDTPTTPIACGLCAPSTENIDPSTPLTVSIPLTNRHLRWHLETQAHGPQTDPTIPDSGSQNRRTARRHTLNLRALFSPDQPDPHPQLLQQNYHLRSTLTSLRSQNTSLKSQLFETKRDREKEVLFLELQNERFKCMIVEIVLQDQRQEAREQGHDWGSEEDEIARVEVGRLLEGESSGLGGMGFCGDRDREN
ncbi:hypothetical protein MBLNU230_g2731t1 [Neophaeotheca triangularis]